MLEHSEMQGAETWLLSSWPHRNTTQHSPVLFLYQLTASSPAYQVGSQPWSPAAHPLLAPPLAKVVPSASPKATVTHQRPNGLQGPCATQTVIILADIIIFNTNNLSQSHLRAFALAVPLPGIFFPQKPTWITPFPPTSLCSNAVSS